MRQASIRNGVEQTYLRNKYCAAQNGKRKRINERDCRGSLRSHAYSTGYTETTLKGFFINK